MLVTVPNSYYCLRNSIEVPVAQPPVLLHRKNTTTRKIANNTTSTIEITRVAKAIVNIDNINNYKAGEATMKTSIEVYL